jgi:hypothetical protein
VHEIGSKGPKRDTTRGGVSPTGQSYTGTLACDRENARICDGDGSWEQRELPGGIAVKIVHILKSTYVYSVT